MDNNLKLQWFFKEAYYKILFHQEDSMSTDIKIQEIKKIIIWMNS